MATVDFELPSTRFDPGLAERRSLVRLCAWLTGDADAAEDLAQETLIEAWRHAHKLRDPSGRARWLAAIARHVCLRWRRRQRSVLRREIALGDERDHQAANTRIPTADCAIDHDLERDELAAVLNAALALLPADTRSLLVARYVDEAAHADIAAATGLSEAAVRLKLHRGRQALRQILQTTLYEAAAPYGVARDGGDDWQVSQIWCPLCGEQRLMCCFGRASGSFVLRCPQCCADYRSSDSPNLALMESLELFRGVTGVKPAFSRLMRHGDRYFQGAMTTGVAPCLGCARTVPLRMDPPAYRAVPQPCFGTRGVYTTCDACGSTTDICLKGIALWSSHGRRFWHQQRRIRSLPEREVVLDGRPGILITYRSMCADAGLDVLFSRENYQMIGAHDTTTRPLVVASARRERA